MKKQIFLKSLGNIGKGGKFSGPGKMRRKVGFINALLTTVLFAVLYRCCIACIATIVFFPLNVTKNIPYLFTKKTDSSNRYSCRDYNIFSF